MADAVKDWRETTWRTARAGVLAATAGLAAWLVVDPGPASVALWFVAVPVLPASFFINPGFWRGVCPLATLNETGNRFRPFADPPSPAATRSLAWAGVGLFQVLVPARHLWFEHGGQASVGLLIGVGGLALLLGGRWAVRAGFCNGLCPVLPVERLYGQRPLVALRRGRCLPCRVCTTRGCLDLAQDRALGQIGGDDPGRGWLVTPLGVFAASLPGFIVAFAATAGSAGPALYFTTLGASAISWGIVAAAAALTRTGARTGFMLLAALAGGLYYWFAGPAIAAALGTGSVVSAAVRVAGVGLAAWWLLVTVRARRITAGA